MPRGNYSGSRFLTASEAIAGFGVRGRMREGNVERKNMKQNKSVFSVSAFLSVSVAVFGVALVFIFGGGGVGVVLGDTTTDIPVLMDAVPMTTSTTHTSVSTDTESPSRPSGLTATIHEGRVMLAWNPSSDNVGVSGYALYRNGSFMVTVASASFTDTGVHAGNSYEYAVLAGDLSGNKSDKSSSVSVTLPSSSGATTTPMTSLSTTTTPTTTSPTFSESHSILSRPGNLSVKILDNRTVRIAWSAPSGATGIVGYRLFKNGTFFALVTGTTYTDVSVYGGQEYRYSVAAADSAGNVSQRSEEQKIMMPLLTLQTGSTTTSATWTAENNGDTFVVRNADGKVIQGQSIVSPGSTAPAMMSDAAKESAAKNVLKEAVRSGFLPAGTESIPTDNLTPDQLVRLPASQYLDFDNDGISNDDELRFGTDPYGRDTDHDGFSDGDEAASGHDPKRFSPGDGRDKVKVEDVRSLRAAEREVSSQSAVHQDTKKDARYRIERAELVKKDVPDAKAAVRLSGTAVPNALVTLYIYSTPTIVTVKADSLGNWSYDVKEDLEDGDHEAFVAVTDNTGKITSYGEGIAFVKTAEAVTIRPIAEAAETVSENKSPLERSQMEYFFAAFIAILFFSGAALIVVSRKSSGPIVS